MKKMNTRNKLIKTLLVLFLYANTSLIFAQDLSKEDSLSNEFNMVKNDVSLLKRIKITGYIQGQYQIVDSAGAKSYAGGDFPSGSDKRFAIRRGRLKASYINTWSQYVIQLDATEKGVALKDAYIIFTEPWLKSFSIKTGVFDRPFGYEIAYSSSLRESPERGRMSQILFPGERDCGASIIFNPPKTSMYNFIKAEFGYFNGTGIASDFDEQKDLIGRVGISKSTRNEKVKFGLGVSAYYGGWGQGTTTYYKSIENIQDTIYAFTKYSNGSVNLLSERNYKGVDAQFSFESPLGITTIRGEYIHGIQPGTSSSTASPGVRPTKSAATTISGTATGTVTVPTSTGDTTISVSLPITGTAATSTTANAEMYSRNFSGAYFYLLQNIGASKHQLVLKYDIYDPNTDVKGTQINAAGVSSSYGKLSSADVKYTTIGIGWIYHLDENIKITAYYDMVKNEKTKISGYTKDIKDNVFTIRVQYKF